MEVPWWLQATPIRLINAMSPAACVRSEQHEKPARLQESSTFLQLSEGVGEVLNKMTRGDCIKRLIRELLIRQRPQVHCDASFSSLSHSRWIEIDALDMPSELFH